jgi:hypothetical protein
MTERKGRIEEWDVNASGFYVYTIEFNGLIDCTDIDVMYESHIQGAIAQGNAFYDRESAELKSRKDRATVKWERLCKKYSDGKGNFGHQAVFDEMGEDMELLK